MRTNTIPITTGLTCPCCGQPMRREWMQPTGIPGRPAHSQTDCLNPNCAGYYKTLSIEAFFKQFATASDNSSSQS